MKIWTFGKIYMHEILIDRFCEFQKLNQKWKFLIFLAVFTHYKAFKKLFLFFWYTVDPCEYVGAFSKKIQVKIFSIKIIVSSLVMGHNLWQNILIRSDQALAMKAKSPFKFLFGSVPILGVTAFLGTKIYLTTMLWLYVTFKSIKKIPQVKEQVSPKTQ